MNTAAHEEHPVLFPLGVTHPHQPVAYISYLTSGIEAIDLNSGTVLWKTDITGKPLIVHNDQLIVQRPDAKAANIFTIVSLDVNNKGSLLLSSDAIELPHWIDISTNQLFGRRSVLDERNTGERYPRTRNVPDRSVGREMKYVMMSGKKIEIVFKK